MRERGLKHVNIRRLVADSLSLPMRERGLKPSPPASARGPMMVAPHAGAWIETAIANLGVTVLATSLPMRERGLKRFQGGTCL